MLISVLKSILGFIVGAIATGGLTWLGFKYYFSLHPIDGGQIGGFFVLILFVVFVIAVVAAMAVVGGVAGAFLIRHV